LRRSRIEEVVGMNVTIERNDISLILFDDYISISVLSRIQTFNHFKSCSRCLGPDSLLVLLHDSHVQTINADSDAAVIQYASILLSPDGPLYQPLNKRQSEMHKSSLSHVFEQLLDSPRTTFSNSLSASSFFGAQSYDELPLP
jgi:hypothetical protein